MARFFSTDLVGHAVPHVLDRDFYILRKHKEETFLSYLQNEHFTSSSGLWDAPWRGKGYSLNALDSFWSVIDQMVAEEGNMSFVTSSKLMSHLSNRYSLSGV